MASVTIVSNRLPISVKKIGDRLEFYPSSGGLATGLASYTEDSNNKWVGWPGIVTDDLTDSEMEQISSELAMSNCYPVFLSQKDIDDYYNGYSNSILWPFFHNMSFVEENHNKLWNVYMRVNQLFAEIVLGLSEPESTIWVHDYQLMLVPEILRQERPYNLVGFFLHIPFPESHTFKKLPHAKSILKGILGSDLIGFHTDTYVQDFLDSCKLSNIGKRSGSDLLVGGRAVKVTDFPLGIDYTKFSKAGKSDEVKKRVKSFKKIYGRRRKIILTVDRLDPTKGLVERLLAYQDLLKTKKKMRKKVVMVMLAIPSRSEIATYKKLKNDVEKLVIEINDTYGTRRWQPVHYMYKTVSFEKLAAMYRMADVAFIAPIKDGMNLVAKEYIASHSEMQGVLILSETAGAANELTAALLVNPNRPKSMVDGLSKAITMSPNELKKRVKDMRHKLATNTVHHWKRAFMGALESSHLDMNVRTKQLSNGNLTQMIKEFHEAKNPSILIDYDGVLVNYFDNPDDARPSPRILNLLKKLANITTGGVMIISGRSKNDLEKWLGNLPITLAAEHGAIQRASKLKPWIKVTNVSPSWKAIIKPTLQKYADKTAGAFVEEKECSLVWHYRNSPTYYAQKNMTILRRVLAPILKTMGLKIYSGNMILEIKSPYANKGAATKEWIKPMHDFILAFGDDYTDEDTFTVLPDNAYTVKVGKGKTMARYRVSNVEEVHKVLEKLVKSKS